MSLPIRPTTTLRRSLVSASRPSVPYLSALSLCTSHSYTGREDEGNTLSPSTPVGWEDMHSYGRTYGTYGEYWQHLLFGYVYESPRTAVGHHFARLPGSCSPERWAFTLDTFLVLEGQSVQFWKKLIRRLARGSSSRDLFYYLVRVHLACLVPPVHSSAPTEQGRPP